MIRQIIQINEDKCDGCEFCIPSCPEGAIQIIDGKAKLVKDFYCDGLGACIGNCPRGAITVIEREAEPYNEKAVMMNVIEQGDDVIKQHLEHLRQNKEFDLLNEAELALAEYNKASVDFPDKSQLTCNCPGSQSMEIEQKNELGDTNNTFTSSLTHWPIQMHLISPLAPHYKNSHLLLAADCVAFSMTNFHQKFLTGKTLAIACPKLDQNQQVYLDKLVSLIENSEIQSIQVMIMQVPCCSGLAQLAQIAKNITQKDIPINIKTVNIRGEVISDQKIA